MATLPVSATTFYIRTDGGTPTQCTGLVDAPFPGTGTGQPCAWSHPFWALPPGGIQTPLISSGDSLMIGPGSYMIGYGAPNTGDCGAEWAFDCTMAPVPPGVSAAQPTRILGFGWDTGCGNAPELWGTERVWHVLDLTGSTHVEVACLEITDHSGCVEFHSGGLACERDTPPFGPWAAVGIVSSDATGVTLRDLNIHGLASTGVLAGRLTDWTVEDVRIAANGWAGWDGDIDGTDANSGTLTFRRWVVEWNGCAETYPSLAPTGCWAQSAGGYGDGVGTGFTGGTWVIEDSRFNYNTSDGLDLLYLGDPNGRVELRRVEARGNAGNQVKTQGTTVIENSVIVGNCGFFDGQPFTFNVDNCRALGNALSMNFQAGTQSSLVNSTLYSEGDCIVLIGGSGCNGSESLVSRNNIFVGDIDFLTPSDLTCFAYNDGCPGTPLDQDWGVIFNVKNNPCPVGPNDLCGDPLLLDRNGDTFDAHLTPTSPARDTGLPVGGLIPDHDFEGNPRPIGAEVDRGAFEFSRDLPFADGFETGDLSAWSAVYP